MPNTTNPITMTPAEFGEWLSSADGIAWRVMHPPMRGGDDGDDDGDTSSDEAAASSGSSGEADSDADDDGDSDDDDGDSDDDDDDDGDELAQARAEAARQRRRAAEEQKRRRKIERTLAKRQRDQKAEQGQYKELYEQSQQEVVQLKSKIKDGARDRSVLSIAQRLKFHDPADAVRLADVPADAVDDDGEVDGTLIEQAVKDLAKKSPHLVERPKPQGEVTGSRGTRRNGGIDNDKIDPRARIRRGLAARGS